MSLETRANGTSAGAGPTGVGAASTGAASTGAASTGVTSTGAADVASSSRPDPGTPVRETALGPGAPTGPYPGGRQTWLLAVCCVAQFMVILDLSIVNVALPSIQTSLGFTASQLQWVVDAYAIVFAGFLILGGRGADHFGQRRTFVAALLLFAVTSAAGGLSVDPQMLIGARALQGLAGALMAATSLAIITSSFPPGPARHRAIGLWGAMNGAGGAAGALAGGLITQELSWRWILLINPPIGIAAAVVAYLVVAERKNEKDGRRLDVLGAVTLTAGQLVLVYGIVTAGVDGWTTAGALVPMAVGAGALVLFGFVEARWAAAPLVPFAELTRSVRVANVVVFLFSVSLFSMWYVSSLYLQQVLGLSPLKAGLTFLPMAVTIMLCASRAGRLVGRFGVRAVLGSGLVLMASGMLLFTRIGPTGSALGFVVLPGVLTAAGIGLSIVPSTIFATQAAGPAQAGLASGLVNTSRQAGGGLGLALLISLATGYTSAAIGRNVGVPLALTEGFRLAYLVGAVFVVAAAAVALRYAPSKVGAPAWPVWRVSAAVAVVVVCFVGTDFAFAGAGGAPIGAYQTTGAYSFVSAPGLHPPQLTNVVPADTGQLAPGYIMLANFYDLTVSPMTGQSGPLIVNQQLQPVWFRPVPKDVVASNLTVQTYKGEPVLTWWQGVVSDTGATESGEDVIVDQHYRTVATLKGADGWVITLHELVIKGDDAWVTANKNVPMNLSKYGGSSNGVLDDSAVQEYDIATGRLLYTWDALDHIPLTASEAPPQTNGFPWDAYHVNSISLMPDGNFLVSMRNTWAAYMVDAKDGDIEWQLGGKSSNFKLAPDASFSWQHDVHVQSSSSSRVVVTLFDDDCCEVSGAGTYLAPEGPSRAEELELNTATGTASLLGSYGAGAGLETDYMGNMQLLAGGNVFVGWGSEPYFSEYSRSGKLLLQAKFPSPDLSYRATVGSWVGQPQYPPSGAARRSSSGAGTTVYASWNGATGVESWRVLAGPSPKDLSAVAKGTAVGFETKIDVPKADENGNFKVFEVEALGAAGQVMGRSRPFGVG